MNTLLMIGTPEIIFIAIIVLILFGGKKIPELMKGIGKGVRSFKEGMNDTEEKSATSTEKQQLSSQEQKQVDDENSK